MQTSVQIQIIYKVAHYARIFKVQNGLVEGDVSGGPEPWTGLLWVIFSTAMVSRLKHPANIPLYQAILDLENFPHNATLYKLSV